MRACVCACFYVRRCDALRKLFAENALRVVDHAVRAPLVTVVQELRGWMMDGEGEGVVLTIGSRTHDRGCLAKWKTATEGQGRTPDLLAEAMRKLQEKGQHRGGKEARGADSGGGGGGDAGDAPQRVQAIHPAVVDLVHVMHAVSVSDCKGRSHKAVAEKARLAK